MAPFHSLLQGAWLAEPEKQQRRPPLRGLQVLVAAPDAARARRVAERLCERVHGGASPLSAVPQAMAELECTLVVDLTMRREALLADSWDGFGAALAVSPERSAAAMARWALGQQMGVAVWSEVEAEAEGSLGPLGRVPPLPPVLRCEGVPPVALSAVGGATRTPYPALRASVSAQPSPTDAVTDGGIAAASGDAALAVIDAAVPTRDGGLGPGSRAGAVIPRLALAAVRTRQGEFTAAAAMVTSGPGQAGQIALPARRLMVGEEGIVLVDPGLLRPWALEPLAAYRAYDLLAEGKPVAQDVLALLAEGPVGLASPYVHHLHVEPEASEDACVGGNVANSSDQATMGGGSGPGESR